VTNFSGSVVTENCKGLCDVAALQDFEDGNLWSTDEHRTLGRRLQFDAPQNIDAHWSCIH
jgi:hypothetical protein